MSHLNNPQFGPGPQQWQNQPQPPQKKSSVGKTLGIIGAIVAASLVFLIIGTALGQSGKPSVTPTVTVTETAKPEPAPTVTKTAPAPPAKTVTAKPKPAPTKTVTAPADPQDNDDGPTGTAAKIASENANCNWAPESESGFTVYSSSWCHGVIVAVPANQDPTTVAYILAAELDETDGWYMVVGSDYIYYTPDSDDAHYVSNSYGGEIYTDDI